MRILFAALLIGLSGCVTASEKASLCDSNGNVNQLSLAELEQRYIGFLNQEDINLFEFIVDSIRYKEKEQIWHIHFVRRDDQFYGSDFYLYVPNCDGEIRTVPGL